MWFFKIMLVKLYKIVLTTQSRAGVFESPKICFNNFLRFII